LYFALKPFRFLNQVKLMLSKTQCSHFGSLFVNYFTLTSTYSKLALNPTTISNLTDLIQTTTPVVANCGTRESYIRMYEMDRQNNVNMRATS